MKNKFINLYFVTSIMMELLHSELERKNFVDSIMGKSKVGLRKSFTDNHKKLKRAIEQAHKSIEFLGNEYSEALSVKNFDNIRSDANYLLRNIMHIYNASDCVESQKALENTLKELFKQEEYSMSEINKFILK